MYFDLSDTRINYANVLWGHKVNAAGNFVILQKEALGIMNSKPSDSHSSPSFKSNHILKIEDNIFIENYTFDTNILIYFQYF